MKTKPSKLLEVLKHILVYSYVASKDSDEIIMNQESFAGFLNMSSRSVIRHFNTAKELGLIDIVGKKHIYNNEKRSVWATNIYNVDIQALNTYIREQTGYDMLDNIEHEIHKYYDFMTYVKETCQQKLIESMDALTRERYVTHLGQQKKKKAQSLARVQKKNEKYIKLLEEVNNPDLPLQYLGDNKKRLINVLCATRNPETSGDASRMRILKRFFNTEQDIVEFDTNASIYRLSYALGNGRGADTHQDIYKLIFDECHFEIPWTVDLRNNFKRTLMPIYMRESSLKYKSAIYNRRKFWKRILSKQEKAEQKFFSNLEMALNMSIYDILDTIRKAMHKVFNLAKFYKADIFIYESNLHILMLKIFKDLGIKTINVYDGFYFVRGTVTEELYNNVYNTAVKQLCADCA